MTTTAPARSDAVQDIAELIAATSPRWTSVARARDGRTGRVDPAALRPGLAFGVELIHEGYLLHYGDPRACDPAQLTDALRLLIGDFCYAAGLREVAAAGDVDAVHTLSRLIADVAAHAATSDRDGSWLESRWDAGLHELRRA